MGLFIFLLVKETPIKVMGATFYGDLGLWRKAHLGICGQNMKCFSLKIGTNGIS